MISKALLILSLAAIGAANDPPCMDTAQLVHQDGWFCISGKHNQAAFIRGYMSSGEVDPNVVYNMQGAFNNFMDVGIYMFPCFPCGNPAKQAQDLITALNGQRLNSIWIDVETYQWSSNVQTNQAFITTLANTLKSVFPYIGIYTSRTEWSTIVGLNWSGLSWAMLWYFDYDNQLNFNDFQPFGGWKQPTMKQYHGSTINTCGVLMNLDYCPQYS